MTEMKFRIWNKNKEVYDYCSFNELYKFMQLLEFYLANYDYFPIVIEQFTGFYHNNSIEIYVGDIILFDGLITEVRFIDGSFDLVSIENGIVIFTFPIRNIKYYDNFKVIGNIHEHKHLLSEKL